MKVLFITPAPLGISPGQRFRFEHYLPFFEENKIEFEINSFLTTAAWKILYSKGNMLKKSGFLIRGVFKRFFLLFSLSKFDIIYLYREALPFGPPVFEYLIAKLFRKKIIYDFDDAIWVKIASSANPMASTIKCTWKVKYICKWSYITTVGNDYLAAFAKKYCNNVVIIPTVVDTETVHNKIKNQLEEGAITIGWTGTFTNFYNLEQIILPIKKLQENYGCKFLIIGDKDPFFSQLQYEFVKWNKATEINDLSRFNIGVMPLNNSEVELGKCGFKAIQYLSLGIPAVVSPVGANCQVVQDGVTGFWATTEADWYNKLELLINDTDKRISMGKVARQHIIGHYSVTATIEMFFKLFILK